VESSMSVNRNVTVPPGRARGMRETLTQRNGRREAETVPAHRRSDWYRTAKRDFAALPED
jgi:hypothetical protein